jgi:DNA-binding transcriptional MerR regulator
MSVMEAAELTISEAARSAGVTAHTLRYYERAGLLDPVGRAGSGHRRYAESDLQRIVFITRLRSTGMPIREIRRYFELVRAGPETEPDRLALLQAHRDRVLAQLDEFAHHLQAIDFKIDLYEKGTIR